MYGNLALIDELLEVWYINLWIRILYLAKVADTYIDWHPNESKMVLLTITHVYGIVVVLGLVISYLRDLFIPSQSVTMLDKLYCLFYLS